MLRYSTPFLRLLPFLFEGGISWPHPSRMLASLGDTRASISEEASRCQTAIMAKCQMSAGHHFSQVPHGLKCNWAV